MTTLLQAAPPAKAVGTDDTGGHWYGYDNNQWHPLYEPGGTFTLREARKLKEAGQVVVPSVTTIFRVLHKEQLVKWKMENVAKAMFDQMYNDPGVDVSQRDEIVESAIATANSASKGAADLGTAIHGAVESALAGQDWDADLSKYVNPVMAELDKRGLLGGISEQCVGSTKYGYAGRCDYHHGSKRVVLDFKSRKSKGKKVGSYRTDAMQLGAYGYAITGNAFFRDWTGMIFAISTTEPGLITVHEYPGKDLVAAMEAYLSLCNVWRYENNFDPRTNQ